MNLVGTKTWQPVSFVIAQNISNGSIEVYPSNSSVEPLESEAGYILSSLEKITPMDKVILDQSYTNYYIRGNGTLMFF